ncbi:MAG TPA: apolipoprotein N-acyltransferase [archaeon]|nr:apolipoprotein N-acyltransferase [archaeon]
MKNRFLAIAPLLSGLLLVLCFPPFKLFMPSFLALVPLFYFIENESSTCRASLGAMFCGLIYWGGLLYWITLFTRVGFLVLIILMSINQVAVALLVKKLKERFGLPLLFSAPFVWTAIEYVHAHGDLAFTWGQLAYSLTDYPLWLQMASCAGPYGITLWLVFINALIYELVKRLSAARKARPVAGVLIILFAGPFILGLFHFLTYEKMARKAPQIRVSYIQPNIPQEIKWSPEMQDSTFRLLASLSEAQSQNGPDLILWPEAAAPAYLRIDQHYRHYVETLASRLKVYLFTGAPEYRRSKKGSSYDSYNSAFLFSPEGRIVGYYDKIKMVPVSERWPYEDIFPVLKEIDVGGSHFATGNRHVVFQISEKRFGALICFESIFPELSAELVRRGAQFVVNITNDAWFERTSAASQHSSFLVLRAIEQRREIVRAANTGISACYDPLGRRRKATALFETASATDTIRAYDKTTFYCRYGDWPAHLAWTVSIMLVVLLIIPRKLLIKMGLSDIASRRALRESTG